MDIGIIASDCYFPNQFVSQQNLELFDQVTKGKYTLGLGQESMAVAAADEDINSMMMNALHNLMTKNGLSYTDIGRLEVGTETIVDKSKSTKTVMMDLFEGHSDVLGVTNINACYGGTAALFNTIDWMGSPAWNGKYGVVLMGDIAVYAPGAARPTGGAGVVALLIGPKAPIVFEPKLRASHFENVYDFYKPNPMSEYPEVNGEVSNSCYLKAVDKCYQSYMQKYQKENGHPFTLFNPKNKTAHHVLFHQPYQKLVQKSFGRLFYNEKCEPIPDSYTDSNLNKTCVDATKTDYSKMCFPYTNAGRLIGNSYTGSLYFSLLNLISNYTSSMKNDRVLLFSYGSGLSASMFSCVIKGSLKEQAESCGLMKRLAARKEISAQDFTTTLTQREQYSGKKDFEFNKPISNIVPGSFYLKKIDRAGQRIYGRVQQMSTMIIRRII